MICVNGLLEDLWGMEEAYTVSLMCEHGHNNVRGGGWNSPNDIPKPPWMRNKPRPSTDSAATAPETISE